MMKAKKTHWKTTFFPSIIILFFLAAIFTYCSKDDDPDPVVKSSAKQITSFVFQATTNPIEVNVTGTIDEGAKTISATMPSGTNISGLLPEMVISPGAEVNPNTVQDFTNPVNYTVSAEDGSKVVYTATVTTPLSQRQILQAILDANPANTLSWNLQNTVDLGTLDGVTTDAKGDIVALFLQNRNLMQYPPEIGQLTNLDTLDLARNQFASLPPEIGLLTNLETLFLYRNQLTSLPAEIGQLTNLEMLNLSVNQLTSLPAEIGQLTNLERLYLSTNQLISIPSEIGQLTNLETLDLRSNKFTSIPVEIVQLTNLTYLSLSSNNLSSLLPEIGQLTNLETLDLRNNQFTSIPLEIGQLTNLEKLHLNVNQLISIPPEIGFITSLRTLDIQTNSLTTIPQAICYLEEFNNLFLAKDAGAICTTTSEKDALISIYSANPGNTLAWSVDSFPEMEFNTSGSPTVITMNNKNLTRLPDNMDQLTALKTLNVSQNSFGSIPSSLGNISTLGVLTLHNTNISTVPSELGQLTNLALLTLTDNPITSIPKSVCDLQTSKGGILTILTDSGEGCE